MNLNAKLFVCGEERELLYTNIHYFRRTDEKAKVTSALLGGFITVTFEAQMYDDNFIKWITANRIKNKKIAYPFNRYTLRDGKVVFYEKDFDSLPLFEYNFKDGALVKYHETFDNQKGLQVTLTISPAMQDYRFFNNSSNWREQSKTRYMMSWKESYLPPRKPGTYKSKETETTARKPKILNGWWTKNKNDTLNLKKAKLGDTVYFHIETRYIKDGEEIDCQLWDLDKFIWDYLKPDDKKFNKKEVHKKAIVKNNKAIIELYLNESWEPNLKEDTAYDIELYWEVKYKEITKSLPKRERLNLEVEFSDRTLFFKPAIAGDKLPQLIAKDGSPVFIVELGKAISKKLEGHLQSEAKEELKNKVKKALNKKLDEAITDIALVKLTKGELKDASGKAYAYSYNSFKKETITEALKKQGEYATHSGKKLQILTALRKDPFFGVDEIENTLTNLFDIAKFSMSSLKEITSKPLNVPVFLLEKILPKDAIVGVSLWLEFLNHLALQEHKKQEAMLSKIEKEQLEAAKKKGLEAVRRYIETPGTGYNLIAISNKTLSKLLIGEFNTFEELLDFNNSRSSNIQLLFFEKFDKEKGSYITIIETILFDA